MTVRCGCNLFVLHNFEGGNAMKSTRLAGFGTIFAAGFIGLMGSEIRAQDKRLTIELNKLEVADDGACRALFLFRNQSGFSLDGFEMSLAVVNDSGVIDRLLTLDAAPIPIARTTLKLFEIPETDCGSIGEMIMHDVTSCEPQNAEPIDCYEIIDLTSRSDATLTK